MATGCRDESAARSVLNELEKRADKVRSGIRSVAEDSAIDHQGTPLADHLADFIAHKRAQGLSRRINDMESQLRRVVAECNWQRLTDLDAPTLERWLYARAAEGMSAATRNEYRSTWLGFGSWCVDNYRLTSNPLTRVPRADVRADRRRVRRALAEHELRRLLYVARLRPIADHGREAVRRDRARAKGKRSNWTYTPLDIDNIEAAVERARQRLAKKPDFIAERERLGRERALLYKTLVLTGLRKSELASLTVGQLLFDEEPACVVLDAADEKNREGNTIPLRGDLAADLRAWLAEKAEDAAEGLSSLRFEGSTKGNRGAEYGLPADSPLFTVPAGLIRILDRDLAAAGIPKTDDRGRTVDVHALRHTFGTQLSRAGVAPRTAQAAMRHSTINLTMNTYTDPRLLDVAGAMESLPSFPLDAQPGQLGQADVDVRATGTDDNAPLSADAPAVVNAVSAADADDSGASEFAPKFAPNADKRGILGATTDTQASERPKTADGSPLAATAYPVTKKDPQSTADNGSSKWAMTDLNRRHPRCKRGALAN